MSWTSSGIYSSKEAAVNGARWWRKQGFTVKIAKVRGGWKHYRKR